jgi:hypothetical protein
VGVGAVVRQLAASRSLPAISSQLYAGVWSASTCSVFIGEHTSSKTPSRTVALHPGQCSAVGFV